MTFPHSIMFHHFHGNGHPTRQGSLSAEQFRDMIDWLGGRYTLISATEFRTRALADRLDPDDVCLSFDDALKCQIDVAVPVLENAGLDAFFFVYSSAFTGGGDNLELFSLFRSVAFVDIDAFYDAFFAMAAQQDDTIVARAAEVCDAGYLSTSPFYSRNDKIFRYMRDFLLSPETYDAINFHLMEDRGFDWSKARSNLWMSRAELHGLAGAGHVIGLHSHSHPTKMSKLTPAEQDGEYRQNRAFLAGILPDAALDCMSHPCGDYNADTLSVLDGLGVKIGFRCNVAEGAARSRLEIPREDHANTYREMIA